jgi:nicotinate-nucleotide pyrophosphorylase (carboxylating)
MPNTQNDSDRLLTLHSMLYEEPVRRAFIEDLGRAGDITTDSIVEQGDTAAGSIVARAPGRIAGVEIAGYAFRFLDPQLKFEIQIHDGKNVDPGDIVANIQGSARPILTAERTALNFLTHLSGIATATRDIVASISPHPARVVCTRKTTPGLRALEKYAVRAGGGSNHRFGLDDAALIKDNHIQVAGGMAEAIRRVHKRIGHLVKIEVECDTLQQLEIALKEKIDAVLLDNMPLDLLAEAVRMANGQVLTEASGGITPQNARAVAATGVDLISIGWITHSAPALNLSLDIESRNVDHG